MENLLKYYCDELDELDRKVGKGGKLSMTELEYADVLAHAKKNLLTSEAMMGSKKSGMGAENYGARGYSRQRYGEGGYGENYGEDYGYGEGGYGEGYSYGEGQYGEGGGYSARGRGRGARRDSMGRYADDEWARERLRKMESEAPSDYVKREIQQYGDRMR